ncbi:MAG: prepilin-type N-terminal cleavage/methylation domain-containing protein [Patescibacteria group bacterium]
MKQRGFTLIEIVIATAIFLLFAIGVYQAYTTIFNAIANAHNRALATDLANVRFEVIKNLPYSSVGTVGGTPSGLIAVSETVTSDNVSFTVATTIMNVDDPFDGLLGGGDIFPADYKLVEISITCNGCKNLPPVVITGRVAPKNLETSLKWIKSNIT